MEAPRPSSEHSFIATDVDLAQSTIWWSQPNTPAPVFQNRRDILYEIEENTSTQRGGKKAISKDLYVLYMDYSQTIISVRFDALIPKDITTLSQRHEPPPSRLRQDQLEAAHAQFGARIADAANGKQNSTVGDGTPQALILDLLRPLSTALLPIGTRAYGAIVYSNLANASTQQFDEIRPGDIVSFRNAKFQGHRGAMHQKYSSEVGKPDHVAIVVDWDGTKKKVRAWEQGRESKKVKMESFKLGELRSGEVRVWRVMGRGWVGWEGEGGKA
jgi:myosin tail region-interacting protein MTI1